MAFWYQAIDRIFVQPERLAWLWLVGCSVFVIIVGELVRGLWRRRLFALAEDQRVRAIYDPRRWVISGARVMALLLIVLALADPRAGLGAIEVQTSNLQVVCLLDRSRSMLARDVSPNRFGAGKKVVRDVVDLAGGGAVALATFAGDARIDVPLTRDYQGLLDRLDPISPDDNQATGTNVGAGLATAAACFAERIESPKILIIVTDGETHGVEPELPENMLPRETKVLILGVGDAQRGARIPLSNGRSITVFSPLAPPGRGQGEGVEKSSVIDRPLLSEEAESGANDVEYLMHEGKVVRSKANPEFLHRLAERLGGKFETLGADSATTAIAETIRRAESPAEEEMRLAYRRQAAPRFHWLLLAAIGLLCLEMMLPSKKQPLLNVLRPGRSSSARLLMLCITFSVLATSVGWADEPSQTRAAAQLTARELSQLYNQGVQAYRAGRWSDAESLFRTVSRQGQGSLQSKSRFNLANTHYAIVNRGGISQREAIERLEAAIDLFRQSIAEGRRTEDARANIEIVYRRLLQIQQQQADASRDEDGDEQDESQDSGEQPPQNGDNADERQRPGDSSGRGDGDPSAPGAGGERPPTNRQPSDSSNEAGEPDIEGRSRAERSDAAGLRDDPTEPLTDQQAEDQLRRIRQRARDRRRENGMQDDAGAAPISNPPGLPW